MCNLNINVRPVPELAGTGLDPPLGFSIPYPTNLPGRVKPRLWPALIGFDLQAASFLKHNILPVWAGQRANQPVLVFFSFFFFLNNRTVCY